MPQPKSFPWGREGSLTAKNPNLSATNVIRLNRTHSFEIYNKIFHFKILHFRFVLSQNSSKLSKICSIRLYTPRIVQNSHQLLTYLYYVSEACTGREPSGIPANYANSVQFAHTVREFAPFVNISDIIFQTPAPAENSQEFQRIMQIPRSSPT